MKCFVCNKGKLSRQLAKVDGRIKKNDYVVETTALVCGHCHHVAIEGEDMPEYMRRLADAYRRAHDLYTSDEIRAIRGRINQQRFADGLGVGVASVKRWELGLVQSKAHNRLIRQFKRQKGDQWNYQFNEAQTYAGQRLPADAGLWALAHGPPNL
jgi:putative zinc finger/helix-turn-helix YgiT family protein